MFSYVKAYHDLVSYLESTDVALQECLKLLNNPDAEQRALGFSSLLEVVMSVHATTDGVRTALHSQPTLLDHLLLNIEDPETRRAMAAQITVERGACPNYCGPLITTRPDRKICPKCRFVLQNETDEPYPPPYSEVLGGAENPYEEA